MAFKTVLIIMLTINMGNMVNCEHIVWGCIQTMALDKMNVNEVKLENLVDQTENSLYSSRIHLLYLKDNSAPSD